MKIRALLGKSVVVAGVVAVGAFGAMTASTPVEANSGFIPGCVCPHVYDPVLCPNGAIYSNSCFASCYGQTGCTRIGPGPIM
ncbi:MAG: hypothetical protein EA376_14540 [Phycisphaeraceae bacterium]|nr:MAG: hypothetical protein EA376_14540 [Phycisphaeraceae bacterium]